METKANLAKAIISVIRAVKGVDKGVSVGTGLMSYKGVSDEDVKRAIRNEMAEAGLCIIPIGIDAKTRVDRWDETTTYNGTTQTKQKQQVFTEAKTRYLLLHESGESVELEGYGQGVDSQDKSAGKATTYALKYTLLYMFLIPTGKIDDSDSTHSDDNEAPKKPEPKPEPKSMSVILPDVPMALPELIPNTPQWIEAVKYLAGTGTINGIKVKYLITPKNEQKLKDQVLEPA
jgi:hypothetical protein